MALACTFCGIHESEHVQITDVTYADGREAHFCLGCFVSGTVNDGAILLQGPGKAGKTSFCKAFARAALEAERPVVYLPSDQTAGDLRVEIRKALAKSYGEAPALEGEDDHLRILDCYSSLMGVKPETKYVLTNLANLTDLSITLKAAWEGLTRSVLVVDDLTSLVQEAGPDVTLKFLRSLIAKIRGGQALGLFSLTTEILEPRFQNALMQMYDGVLEMKIEEGPEGLERFMRIFSLRGQKHSTKWNRFDITDEGIAMLPGMQALEAGTQSS